MRKAAVLLGKTFGKLLVTGRSSEKSNYGAVWECFCDCGKKTLVHSVRLKLGITRSCGCLRYKHGQAKLLTPTYNSWRSMKARCLNPKAIGYHIYGGRGIKICDSWKSDFRNFLSDMGERPIGTELDRIDVNGNYEAKNCRWATRKEGAKNRRSTRILSCNGKTQTSMEWSDELKIGNTLINNRLNRGYTDKEALYGKNTISRRKNDRGSM